MTTATRSLRWLPWMVAALLLAGIFAVRWPTFGFRVWNVDEAIHAAIARTLLDGGVLYRDAIDQRTPLSYYAVAALFRVSGENNIWAMHALASALIAATAFGLFLLGRAWRGNVTGLGAALFFAVFSTTLFYPGDAYALNPEWFVAAFTTWAAWVFWRGAPAAAGVLLGLAFLSKQPALLDLGAPLAVLAYRALPARERWSHLAARLAGVLGGFAAPVLLTVGYFAARGALADFHFYAWQYNLRYYAPEISSADRVLSALKPFQLLGAHYPLVLAATAGGAAFCLWRVCRPRPEAGAPAENPPRLYLLVWSVTSLAGAAAGGRGFDHYFIQFLPACCLTAALGLDELLDWARAHRFRRFLLPAALVLFAVIVVQLGQGLVRSRRRPPLPVDPSLRAGEFIQAHTRADERIFVWGYHPDLYLFSDRKPASRFVYASFLTGLIPWTNTAPDRDTAYAIVPGTRDTLLRELDAARPTFIVDCSAGPNRSWDKYPPATFPQLGDCLDQNYVEVEPATFAGQGFRLHLIRDSARRPPLPLAGGADARLDVPQIFGTPGIDDRQSADVSFAGTSPDGRLQRLELLHNGAVIAAASFPPTKGLLLKCKVPFGLLGGGVHRLSVRATAANGASATSPEQDFSAEAGRLPPARLAEFALPFATGPVVPSAGRAPFGASAELEEGRLVFATHAPATLSYAVTGDATRLRGHFGFRPGAYAATNPGPTDGAEFLVVFVPPAGPRQTLFYRWLQPLREPGDRGPQSFSVPLPPGVPGTLELSVTNGPAGSAASDWTYWSDLRLETSH